jgi:hypothetical protein
VHYAADQDYRFAKALLDAKRYEVEAAVVQHPQQARGSSVSSTSSPARVDKLNHRCSR